MAEASSGKYEAGQLCFEIVLPPSSPTPGAAGMCGAPEEMPSIAIGGVTLSDGYLLIGMTTNDVASVEVSTDRRSLEVAALSNSAIDGLRFFVAPLDKAEQATTVVGQTSSGELSLHLPEGELPTNPFTYLDEATNPDR